MQLLLNEAIYRRMVVELLPQTRKFLWIVTADIKDLRAMKKNGSPPPVFDFDEDHSYFLIRLPVHRKEKAIPKQQDAGEVTGEVNRLLSVLSGPMKRTDIQNVLGLKHEDHFREAYLSPAFADGLVEMTIPDKPTSRLQKYRLTAKGKTLISNR